MNLSHLSTWKKVRVLAFMLYLLAQQKANKLGQALQTKFKGGQQ
jgi:hypothetical protein